jgi:hypothetical protein
MKRKSISLLTLIISLLGLSPAVAHWSVTERAGSAKKDFVIGQGEAVEELENGKLYALVEYGIISKIFIWDQDKPGAYVTTFIPGSSLPLEMIEEVVFVAKMPESLAVNFQTISGEVKYEPINQGKKVAVVEELPPPSFASELPQVVDPVAVISKNINSDYSTSMTVLPVAMSDENKSVEVQVITNGISFTSITTDNSETPITINNLPSDSFVSVQTVIRDRTTHEETVLQNVVTRTPDAQLPTIANSRDVESDKTTIAAPVVTATSHHENGSRSATIEFAGIPNFDPTKTLASIQVVGPGGSTTSIGIDGTGGLISIADLGVDSRYRITMVIRDLNSGEETVIRGANL